VTDRGAVISALEAAVDEALFITRRLAADDCRIASSGEGWPLVVVAYHIGLGLRRQAGFIARALTGEPPFEFEWEPTHDLNAVNAREHGGMSKDTAANEIDAGWDRLQGVIARMGEEDWSRAVFSFDGRARSADVVLRRMVLPHVSQHLESLRNTVSATR
jgi:hypothetical protein